MNTNNGGPAFPTEVYSTSEDGGEQIGQYTYRVTGMTLRDWFAGMVQADDRLVKCVRSMDNSALEIFALCPDAEREEHITEIELTNWMELPSELAKVTKRLKLEARAIARVRFMQADAMLEERKK